MFENEVKTLRDFIEAGLLPDPRGRVVWDLGCGLGGFAGAFSILGAKFVIASDLIINESPQINTLYGNNNTKIVQGGVEDVGDMVDFPVDLVFMHMMTEHVSDLREFFKSLSKMLPNGAFIHISHDNFYQPVGHHDHGLIALDQTSFKVVPQGVACWSDDRKCDASEFHRKSLLKFFSSTWSDLSDTTKTPEDCTQCNYFRRSQPWAHLRHINNFQRTFPEKFFSVELNRASPEQLLWFVQEQGFHLVNERRVWVMNEVPEELAIKFGRETMATFSLGLLLKLVQPARN